MCLVFYLLFTCAGAYDSSTMIIGMEPKAGFQTQVVLPALAQHVRLTPKLLSAFS